MDWLPLTLLCAFSLASADAATKAWLQAYSAREIALIRFSVTGLMLAPFLLSRPLPALPAPFWYWVAAIVPLEVLAMLLYMRAIRDHPLSLTLPYLAFTPVFVTLSGFILLGERVSGPGFAGIMLVVLGAWLLNSEAAGKDWRACLRPFAAIARDQGARMMLAVAALYALTSVGGKGAMRYMPAEQFGPFYFVLLGLITLPLFSVTRHDIGLRVWRRPGAVLIVGALTGIMVLSHFLALQQVETAYMIAVKRTSLLFGILYGALLFREPAAGRHLLAGALMLSGVLLLLL